MLPHGCAAPGVVRIHVGAGRHEDEAVLHHRHRPPAAAIVEARRRPGAAQLRQRVLVDLRQGGVARVAEVAAHRGPLARGKSAAAVLGVEGDRGNAEAGEAGDKQAGRIRLQHGRSLLNGCRAPHDSVVARRDKIRRCLSASRFDLDGVLADMDSALFSQAENLFGEKLQRRRERVAAKQAAAITRAAPPAGKPAALPVPGFELTAREQSRLWRHVGTLDNFWQSLREIEPGAVKRLAAVAAAHRWEVIFLTKRPASAGATAQVQSQRWLVSNGFDRPSVYVVQGSRGLHCRRARTRRRRRRPTRELLRRGRRTPPRGPFWSGGGRASSSLPRPNVSASRWFGRWGSAWTSSVRAAPR